MKKYVLCPGTVTSKADGQRHYVGPVDLAHLYGVDLRECEIYEPAQWWPRSYYQIAEERHKGLRRLSLR